MTWGEIKSTINRCGGSMRNVMGDSVRGIVRDGVSRMLTDNVETNGNMHVLTSIPLHDGASPG